MFILVFLKSYIPELGKTSKYAFLSTWACLRRSIISTTSSAKSQPASIQLFWNYSKRIKKEKNDTVEIYWLLWCGLSINFGINASMSPKIPWWNNDRNCLNQTDPFREKWHLYYIESSDLLTWELFLEPHYFKFIFLTGQWLLCEAWGGSVILSITKLSQWS